MPHFRGMGGGMLCTLEKVNPAESVQNESIRILGGNQFSDLENFRNLG